MLIHPLIVEFKELFVKIVVFNEGTDGIFVEFVIEPLESTG